MSTQVDCPADLLQLQPGQALGTSDWLEISQDRIQAFADASGDHQWIHVDPQRAAEGPYGACIAHGYLILSLVNMFLPHICSVRHFSMGLNYGSDRVRFVSPVRVGDRIRGVGEMVSAESVRDGGVQIITRITVEVEGGERPACVADVISRFYPKSEADNAAS